MDVTAGAVTPADGTTVDVNAGFVSATVVIAAAAVTLQSWLQQLM